MTVKFGGYFGGLILKQLFAKENEDQGTLEDKKGGSGTVHDGIVHLSACTVRMSDRLLFAELFTH